MTLYCARNKDICPPEGLIPTRRSNGKNQIDLSTNGGPDFAEEAHTVIPARFEDKIEHFLDCIEKQRVCIGFCFKLGKTASESFKILKQAFKEDALSQSRTF
ncbi:hypothetical protein LAZ67_19000212 [Cordylochernes scorpioides]|uniref:Mos1 transposase HTH domain-containing protein n=1 Tax=Cordylochernes scorpioides TaxID=51811 RepID=A0ABY6LJ61_9ARAC|nr:hypothetical protein LAZ67_19000212 [Cordylochernes scorpioides]